MHTMKKFIRYYAPYKAVFFLDLICAAVISLVDLAFPQILRTLTKTLFAEPADRILQALLPIGAGLLVIYILQSYEKQGKQDKANTYYQKIIEKYNGTEAATEAQNALDVQNAKKTKDNNN